MRGRPGRAPHLVKPPLCALLGLFIAAGVLAMLISQGALSNIRTGPARADAGGRAAPGWHTALDDERTPRARSAGAVRQRDDTWRVHAGAALDGAGTGELSAPVLLDLPLPGGESGGAEGGSGDAAQLVRRTMRLEQLGAVAIRARDNQRWWSVRPPPPTPPPGAALSAVRQWQRGLRWPAPVAANGTRPTAPESRLLLIALSLLPKSERAHTAPRGKRQGGPHLAGRASPGEGARGRAADGRSVWRAAVGRRRAFLIFSPHAQAWLSCGAAGARGRGAGAARVSLAPLPVVVTGAVASGSAADLAAALLPHIFVLETPDDGDGAAPPISARARASGPGPSAALAVSCLCAPTGAGQASAAREALRLALDELAPTPPRSSARAGGASDGQPRGGARQLSPALLRLLQRVRLDLQMRLLVGGPRDGEEGDGTFNSAPPPLAFPFELLNLDGARDDGSGEGGGAGGEGGERGAPVGLSATAAMRIAGAEGCPRAPAGAAGAALRAEAPRAGGVRLVQLNVREGTIDEPGRLAALARFFLRARVDVLSLNEMNGWETEGFARFAARLGFSHARLLETQSGFHLALASRRPFATRLASSARPFHHGVLVVDLDLLGGGASEGGGGESGAGASLAAEEGEEAASAGRLRICVTHLSPASAAARLAEADVLVRIAAAEPNVPFLLLGDLNTLSPLDAPEHARAGLRARLEAQPSLSAKFLNPSGRLAYGPMGALLGGGLADLGYLSAPGAHSVPTTSNTDAMHAAAMRLDYALVNAPLQRLCGCARAAFVRTEETARLSDHFPLLVELGGCALRPPAEREAGGAEAEAVWDGDVGVGSAVVRDVGQRVTESEPGEAVS